MKEVLATIPRYAGKEDEDLLLWQNKVHMYLSTKDLECFVESELPVNATAYQKRLEKKAKAIICTCLADSIVSAIMKEQTALTAWKQIESLYQKKSRTTRTRLIAEFWNMNKEEKTIAEYISAIESLSGKLQAIGKELSDDDLVDRLLSGLPSEFDAVTVTFDSVEKLTFHWVGAALINFEAQLSHCERDATHFAAHQARKRWCKIHKNSMHSNEECWSQHPELRPKHANKEPRSFNYTDPQIQSITQRKADSRDRSWIIDSGSSLHITSDESRLNMIKDLKIPVPITVANNETISITKSGLCQVSSDNVNLRISPVYHSRSVASNLLSVGALTSNGYSLTFKDDRCTIYDSTGHDILSVNKDKNNLYSIPESGHNSKNDNPHLMTAQDFISGIDA